MPQYTSPAPAGAKDPLFSLVGNLLHFNNNNNDSSAFNVAAIDTGVGNVFDTQIYKFGQASKKFNGAGLTYQNFGAQYNVGTGPFTAECWVYVNGTQRQNTGIFCYENGLSTQVWQLTLSNYPEYRTPVVEMNGMVTFLGDALIPERIWTHMAITRNASGLVNLWVNGLSSLASGVSLANLDLGSGYFIVGSDKTIGIGLIGNMADVRFTKTNRYTTNFTPPTTAFPNS